MKLKKEFHNKILRRIYYHTVIDKKILPKRYSKRRIYLFGVPEHLNYGDIAIFVSELKFLKENLPDFEVITIPERLVIQKIFEVKEIIDDDDIVALHGGGNMGDVWPFPDMIRQDVIRAFGDKYRLISFPQSISYNNEFWVNETQQILKNCIDISIFARDKKSFKIMKEVFPRNVKCFLSPDMVMSLNENRSITPSKYDVLFLMRKDKEKLSNPYYDNIFGRINKKYEYKLSDTVDSTWYRINDKTAPKRLSYKLRELQKAKLVVTDRLHGMIFSYITRTPVLVFDNNNHKIRNLYNKWFAGRDNAIFFIDNKVSSDGIDKFIENAINQSIEIKKINLDYSPLIQQFLG